MENRDFLQKADLALSELTSGGGVLQEAQAKKFMRIPIEESVLLKEITVEPMKAPSQLIEKTNFASRVMRAATDGQALSAADRSKPFLGKVQLDAKEMKGEVRLSYSTVEDNIEQGTFVDTVMQMLGERVSLDLEELVIKGDTASSDTYLALFNGMLKAATSNVVDAGVINISRASHLKAAIKLLPEAALRMKKSMRFYTSTDVETDYRDALADRATMAGDRYVLDDAPVMYGGVPLVGVPLFPNNLNAGGGSNESNVVLTDPKNAHAGIWRQVRLEWEKDIKAGLYVIVVTMRVGFVYEHEPFVVKCIKVKAT